MRALKHLVLAALLLGGLAPALADVKVIHVPQSGSPAQDGSGRCGAPSDFSPVSPPNRSAVMQWHQSVLRHNAERWALTRDRSVPRDFARQQIARLDAAFQEREAAFLRTLPARDRRLARLLTVPIVCTPAPKDH